MHPLPQPLPRIQDRLTRGAAPAEVIAELLPRSREEAVAYARRLPLWDEYRGRYSDQAVALACVISRRAMREFGLAIGEDGRVTERFREGVTPPTPKPSLTFPLAVRGEDVRVEYTSDYFPRSGQDHFYFVSPHEPARAHPLSGTGHWSQFAMHDAVEACGGPESYAALYAEARLSGREKEFAALFEGKWPEAKQPRRKRASRPAGAPARAELQVVGGHTAAVAEERREAPDEKQPLAQKSLF
jgi:hypothetical protein